MMQYLEGINLHLWISVILAYVLISAVIICRLAARYFAVIGTKEQTGSETIFDIVEEAGYSYDPEQDIFYSNMDPWQRKMGYCRLYDEASAPLNMIIDCEPVYFEYSGKRWMIEFWKGQYAMTAGAEMGIYTSESPDLEIPGVFNGTFYNCAGDEDLLYMSYYLIKNGELLFKRKGKHWWLTGFKLGEFAEPSELTMRLKIVLKDTAMRDAFLDGLRRAGYSEKELLVDGNIVRIIFDKPHTPQPLTRIPETDWIIQRKNEFLCSKYQEITGQYDLFPDKMAAIRKQAPEIYDGILNMGKAKPLYEVYEKIKDYVS